MKIFNERKFDNPRNIPQKSIYRTLCYMYYLKLPISMKYTGQGES